MVSNELATQIPQQYSARKLGKPFLEAIRSCSNATDNFKHITFSKLQIILFQAIVLYLNLQKRNNKSNILKLTRFHQPPNFFTITFFNVHLTYLNTKQNFAFKNDQYIKTNFKNRNITIQQRNSSFLLNTNLFYNCQLQSKFTPDSQLRFKISILKKYWLNTRRNKLISKKSDITIQYETNNLHGNPPLFFFEQLIYQIAPLPTLFYSLKKGEKSFFFIIDSTLIFKITIKSTIFLLSLFFQYIDFQKCDFFFFPSSIQLRSSRFFFLHVHSIAIHPHVRSLKNCIANNIFRDSKIQTHSSLLSSVQQIYNIRPIQQQIAWMVCATKLYKIDMYQLMWPSGSI
eukprot:TRINITY_DN1965_c0_g1_i6.p1 TRINITY_DN1965_c0_g1~~TRINITY_DN1965_c0_g1_i6.p1  ORF type:complete len:343 (+),score=-14.76 TRINITY_DN1965_c0_g1_i6:2224-3252(+)